MDQSWKVRHERVNVDGDHLSFVSNVMNTVGLYVAAKPLSPDDNYFEIVIVAPGKYSCIGIGLVPFKYPLDSQPGWEEFSVGYHADDGQLYKASGFGSPFGEKCNIGDIMGCGIKFAKNEEKFKKAVNVFFTRNGREVRTVTVPFPPGGLYPAVGMHSDGEVVRLKLGAELNGNKPDGMHDFLNMYFCGQSMSGVVLRMWAIYVRRRASYGVSFALTTTIQARAFEKMVRDDLPKRKKCKEIVLNALGLNTWEEVQDSYDQADNMLQFTGDVSTSEGRIQFLTRALDLAKIGKTKWSVQITVKRNGVEIPVDEQLIGKYSDQIIKEIKRKF